jgi:hypothetical protein
VGRRHVTALVINGTTRSSSEEGNDVSREHIVVNIGKVMRDIGILMVQCDRVIYDLCKSFVSVNCKKVCR